MESTTGSTSRRSGQPRNVVNTILKEQFHMEKANLRTRLMNRFCRAVRRSDLKQTYWDEYQCQALATEYESLRGFLLAHFVDCNTFCRYIRKPNPGTFNSSQLKKIKKDLLKYCYERKQEADRILEEQEADSCLA
mmetsp:Transcript_11284/g.22214  ORF Transcript_11284/g.22214 Transcript_11284/m.22214 type:complete len:135 (-) Transcript_11284:72-476(-)